MKIKLSLLMIVLAFVTVPIAAQSDPVCGSVERFNQTKRWEDLPGCLELRGADYDSNAAIVLSGAKNDYQAFFNDWAAGREPDQAISTYTSRVKRINSSSWNSDPQLVAARPAFDEMRRIADDHLARKDSYSLMAELRTAVGALGGIAKSFVENEGKDRNTVLFYLKTAQDAMSKVVATGMPDSMMVGYNFTTQRALSLREVKAKLDQTSATVNKLASSSKAAEEAKWKPFTDVLKGDRLRLFNEYEVGILQGAGGRTLKTPADFQRTAFMAKYTNGRSGILNRWNMTIWRFRGDKIVSEQTKSGWGNDPPSSAFR